MGPRSWGTSNEASPRQLRALPLENLGHARIDTRANGIQIEVIVFLTERPFDVVRDAFGSDDEIGDEDRKRNGEVFEITHQRPRQVQQIQHERLS